MARLTAAVLNSIFQEQLTTEINRETTLLSLLSKRAERKSNVQWPVNVGGSVASGVAINGAAPTASSDSVIPAQLPINSGSIQSSFTINAKEIIEAAEQVSAAELKDLIKAQMTTATDEMGAALTRFLFNGDGTVARGGIFGLTQAVNTLDYAGIDAARYTLWQSAVVDYWDAAAGPTDKRKELDTAAFMAIDEAIRYRGGSYDTIVTTPKVVTKYKKVFETSRQYQVFVQGEKRPMVDLGFDVIGYNNKPIIDDVFCTRTRNASEAAITSALGTNIDEGCIYFLRMADLELLTAPTPESKAISGIYTQMRRLAQNSLYNDTYVVGLIPQLKLLSRKNTGIIRNLKV